MTTTIGREDVQDAIDDAPRGAMVRADPSVVHERVEPLTITTPGVTVTGLRLALADAGDANLIEIGADHVTLRDFALDGRRDQQPGERQSNGVVVTGATNVAIERGRIRDVSRHGIRVVDTEHHTSHVAGNTAEFGGGPVTDVTVRDIRIDRPRRDGCSIEGPDVTGVTVDGVRTYDSSDRGSVEVKDGAEDVLVRNCTATRCVYGVAIQDHGNYCSQNVAYVDNVAIACETLVDAQTSEDLPPQGVLVRGNRGRALGGDGMGGPGGIHLHRIDGLVVTGNRLADVDGDGLHVRNCQETIVSDNQIRDVGGTGIVANETVGVSVHGNVVGTAHAGGIAVTDGRGVRITGNRVTTADPGIALDGVDRYLVALNDATDIVTAKTCGTGTIDLNL